MKAVYIQHHGPVTDLSVSDIPAPQPSRGEVLVQVEASGINPSDVAGVQGRFQHAVLPRVVGRDFAGHVSKGPSELVGAKVWGTGGDLGISRNGAHAEYLVIPVEAVSRRPKTLSAEEAASVGVPFVTAFSALVQLGQVKKGEWVIVSGAAGSVGQAAIQIAHAKGARVVALTKDAGQDWVSKSAGVEVVARSDKQDLEAVVHQATNAKGADLALNGVGNTIFQSLVNSLSVGGRQVIYSAAGGRVFPLDLLSFYHQQLSLFGLDTQKLDVTRCAAILNELVPLFESGTLKPPAIEERYPLSKAPEAYNKVAEGKTGKVVLLMAAG